MALQRNSPCSRSQPSLLSLAGQLESTFCLHGTIHSRHCWWVECIHSRHCWWMECYNMWPVFAWLLSPNDFHRGSLCWIRDPCFVTFRGYIVIHILWVDTYMGLTVCVPIWSNTFSVLAPTSFERQRWGWIMANWFQLLTTSVPLFQALLYFFA